MVGFDLLACTALSRAEDTTSSPAVTIELYTGTTKRLKFQGIRRFLVGAPEFISAEQADANTLTLTGLDIGRTFLHVWDAAGQHSMFVLVRFPPVRGAGTEGLEEELGIERSRPLRVTYIVNYEALRRGEDFKHSDVSTTNRFRHAVYPDMETPYGDLSGFAEYQRLNEFHDLTSWRTELSDGHIGPLQDFDARAGDVEIPFSGSIGVPALSYYGGDMVYRGIKPWTMSGFWGRQRESLLALSPERSDRGDAYVAGAQVGLLEPRAPWRTRVSAVAGYGDARLEPQSDYVFDAETIMKVLPPLTLEMGGAIDDANEFGYLAGPRWSSRRLRVSSIWRDVRKDFEVVGGPGPYQGERGVATNLSIDVTPTISADAAVDVYQDRLFPNSAEPDAWNESSSVSGTWELTRLTTLSGHVLDDRTPGLQLPAKRFGWGVAVSQGLAIRRLVPVLQSMNVYSSFDHDEARSSSLPSLDSDTETISTGGSIGLPLGFSASASHEWRLLKELESGVQTRPRRFSAGLGHYVSLFGGRVDASSQLSYERERESGSISSGLTGQDRLSAEVGFETAPVAGTSLYLNGSYDKVRFEVTGADTTEFGLFTGARVLFDSRVVRWEPPASVRGTVFQDDNADGVRQPNEPGLPGVQVVAGIAQKVKTDAEGRFRFRRVSGKAIPISLDLSSLPTGYRGTTPRAQVIRPGAQPKRELEFGAQSPGGDVRGHVYVDLNGNGQYDAGDLGIDDIPVTLDTISGRTDRNGLFLFGGLRPGSYTLTLGLERLPLEYLPTVPVRQSTQVASGKSITIDFPLTVRRSLAGRVYVDANGNQRFDGSDQPLPGTPICLDGRLVGKTDPAGIYQFSDVSPGLHQLVLNCGIPMDDLLPLSDPDPVAQIAPNAPDTLTVDFRLDRKESILERRQPPDSAVESDGINL